jgi:serine/threonine-protein kinase RsbW
MKAAMTKAPFTVRLEPSEAAVEDGRAALLAYLQPCGLDDRALNRIEVALEELVSNVVRHSVGASFVSISASRGSGAVSVTVEDDGAAFNPLEQAEPRKFDKLENAALGGLGIGLIKRLAQSVNYVHADGQNRVTLTFDA